MDYNQKLKAQFEHLEINLVKHDTSFTGLPCYIECNVGAVKKSNRSALVLDLGNYIARLGLRYQMTPEFCGKGKETTLRWFCSWQDIESIRKSIYQAVKPDAPMPEGPVLPLEFRSLIVQNVSRGVKAA